MRFDDISVRVQHHPSRTGLPRRLIAHLGAFEDVQVITDPGADGSLDAWRAHRAVLESLPATASHLVSLQDDALPVPGFSTRLCTAVDEHPDVPLCLFAPGFNYIVKQMQDAQKAGLSVTPMRVGAFVPLVGIVYPRAFVGALLDWVDNRSSDRQRRRLVGADDGVLALYCRHARIQPLLLVPSIVEHDESVQSIGKFHRRSGPHRRAALLASS